MLKEFLNVANEEKFTIGLLGGKLFQTFTTRSLKKFFRIKKQPEKGEISGGHQVGFAL